MLNVVMARAFAVDIQMESSGNEENIFVSIVFLAAQMLFGMDCS